MASLRYLLDANFCIEALNGRSDRVATNLAMREPAQIAVSSIVISEVLYGARISSRPAENMRLAERFFEAFISIPFDNECARHYSDVRADLRRRGLPIGAHDLQIAASALANDLIVVTHNTAEFSRVTGLKYVDWQV